MEGGAVYARFGPYIDASCQVWLHLAKLFQRRRFFNIIANQKKEIILAAMFVGRIEPNEEALQRILHRCFLPSLAPFCQAVSEEKIFLNSSQSETRIALGGHICWWNGTKWRHFIEDLTQMLTVWFHLAKLFQRRRLKYEKVNGRTTDANLRQQPGELKMMKTGNNSQTGNQIYFKIAGHIDLDKQNMFSVYT